MDEPQTFRGGRKGSGRRGSAVAYAVRYFGPTHSTWASERTMSLRTAMIERLSDADRLKSMEKAKTT